MFSIGDLTMLFANRVRLVNLATQEFRMAVALIALNLALAGCAASVTKSASSDAPVRVGLDSSKEIVLNVTGSDVATQSKDWEQFKAVWKSSMQDEATTIGATFVAQDGTPKATGDAGTLIVVEIADYRYLSAGSRVAFGVMTGNAFVKSKVKFIDLSTGSALGEHSYDTSSTAWQGVFSAMTDKQVRAICKEIGDQIGHH
jgi:hypothetical protein